MDLIFDETSYTIMIPTVWILPAYASRRDLRQIFNMKYSERIEKFCTEDQKKQIRKMKDEHPEAVISEYFNG